MSTTFVLLPVGGEESSVPSLDISEQSMKFEVTAWTQCIEGCGTDYTEFTGLSADEVVDVALKMLNVVLYSYPEKLPTIQAKLQELRY